MPGSRKTIRRTKPPKNSNLEGLKNFWDSNYSGEWGNSAEGQALADAFYAMYGDGKFHSGAVGGIDRQYDSFNNVMNEYGEASGGGFNQNSPFGNDWLGPDHEPLSDIFGKKIEFRREVSPYMMYMHPEDPNMWDELPNPATPSRGEAGMNPEHMADPWLEDYSREYMADRMQDLLEIARRTERKYGSSALGDILGRTQNRIDYMRRKASGRR